MSIPVAVLHFRSYSHSELQLFSHFASHTAHALQIPISATVHLPNQRSLWTVPKSPFVHKKAQENFHRIVHKRAIKAWDAHPDVVDRWFIYLQRHILPGVGMRCTKWVRVPIGFGQNNLLGQMTVEQQVKELADEILRQEDTISQTPPAAVEAVPSLPVSPQEAIDA